MTERFEKVVQVDPFRYINVHTSFGYVALRFSDNPDGMALNAREVRKLRKALKKALKSGQVDE